MRDLIVEIMARAMRLRSVQANNIITQPADIQRYVDTSWRDELLAAQAAFAALEAAGFRVEPGAANDTNIEAVSGPGTDDAISPEDLNASNDE